VEAGEGRDHGTGPLEGLARELGSALGRLGLPPEQIEAAVREGIRPALDRLDLVSRSEHEALRAELDQVRDRLAALEARLGEEEPAGPSD
jgi:BMFP domain-containing protein YqiC